MIGQSAHSLFSCPSLAQDDNWELSAESSKDVVSLSEAHISSQTSDLLCLRVTANAENHSEQT